MYVLGAVVKADSQFRALTYIKDFESINKWYEYKSGMDDAKQVTYQDLNVRHFKEKLNTIGFFYCDYSQLKDTNDVLYVMYFSEAYLKDFYDDWQAEVAETD